MHKVHVGSLGAFLIATLLLIGCDGDGMVEVKGAVQVDGKPVTEGAITFVPADGKARTSGGPIKDGTYATRVPIGTMKVSINAQKKIGTKKLYDTPDSPTMPIMVESLPEKYSNRDKTELEYEVKPGPNVKDWDLKSN